MKPLVKWPLISGGVLFIGGPVVGVIGTVLGMIGAFQGAAESGTSNPDVLASDISFSLITTMFGILVGCLGLGLLLFSLVAFIVTRNSNASTDVTGNQGEPPAIAH